MRLFSSNCAQSFRKCRPTLPEGGPAVATDADTVLQSEGDLDAESNLFGRCSKNGPSGLAFFKVWPTPRVISLQTTARPSNSTEKTALPVCVVPALDYASTVWRNPARHGWQTKALNSVQRTAMIGMLAAFRTTATQALEAETHLPPTHLRLLQRGKEVMTRFLTLPDTHPIIWTINKARTIKGSKKGAGLTQVGRLLRTLRPEHLEKIETINICPDAPWEDAPLEPAQTNTDRDMAIEELAKAIIDFSTVIYTDASAKDGNTGAAVVMLDYNGVVCRARPIAVGPESQ